jgi:hypothetical protein
VKDYRAGTVVTVFAHGLIDQVDMGAIDWPTVIPYLDEAP